MFRSIFERGTSLIQVRSARYSSLTGELWAGVANSMTPLTRQSTLSCKMWICGVRTTLLATPIPNSPVDDRSTPQQPTCWMFHQLLHTQIYSENFTELLELDKLGLCVYLSDTTIRWKMYVVYIYYIKSTTCFGPIFIGHLQVDN